MHAIGQTIPRHKDASLLFKIAVIVSFGLQFDPGCTHRPLSWLPRTFLVPLVLIDWDKSSRLHVRSVRLLASVRQSKLADMSTLSHLIYERTNFFKIFDNSVWSKVCYSPANFSMFVEGVFTLVPPSTLFDTDSNFFDANSRFVFTLRVLMMSTALTAKVKMTSNF